MGSVFRDFLNGPTTEEHERAINWHVALEKAERARANKAERDLEKERANNRRLKLLLALMMLMWACAGLLAWLAR